jgi:hypothetical protein
MGLAALLPFGPETPANAVRYANAPGHVESWFLRANDPQSKRALWLKLTLFAPFEGAAVAETWFIWFDGEKNVSLAHRSTHPLGDAHIDTTPTGLHASVGGWAYELGPVGAASASITAQGTPIRFTLGWSEEPGAWSQFLSLARHRAMREGPVPRFKLNTPHPALRFSGEVTVGSETFKISDWLGSQGHNWGNEHAVEYAWGQCLFPAADGAPDTFVEAGAGRMKIGGRVTPRIASMVVRRGAREFHFDRVRDLTHHDSNSSRDRWALRIWGPEGEARLRLDAGGRPMVCLGYPNPPGHLSYCFNSKLAEALLEVKPLRGAPFTCKSAHGAALEFLRSEPDPNFTVV